MGWLEGKVALITGGGSGIGKALVERFIEEGACVGVLERSKEKVKGLQEQFGDRVVIIEGDVAQLEDNERAVAETVQAFGRIDTFIGNAGIFDYFVTLPDLPKDNLEKSFDQVFGVNVKGPLYGAKAALPELLKTKGNIIFTVSNAGFYPAGGGPLYTASKHAVVGLIRELAYELSPKIRVNGVAPGGTLTDLRGPAALGQEMQTQSSVPDIENLMKATNPLKVVPSPREHTSAYVLLASNKDSMAITGNIINSDGGLGVRGFTAAAGGEHL
ncbi:3-(cis-5,6-dihydroxycyclohexa-1,3-dien-1-yl)propanoate dehydrogenase [Neobacillus drentensis]|uniref:3-(cis-5,6-dihydroxycyclohexa-1, 3-dien-1-yl)propanoate dehydrogenase n=1 Tax=Neobacillus drentensis TaxID=220684 RepID=UPI00285AFF0C|nr:3-(cis-5,6-dihydroxycyclohexa-1,3-dien-1-yl)propanoate dehydrogenase [Neobacillus drentensis]MDR7236401.1 NAD(P)-dependent dehydrogenase (short-subunit alcohol dehydrogenase family) [Neobacillus drentensis]